jgi:hypothetical protein
MVIAGEWKQSAFPGTASKLHMRLHDAHALSVLRCCHLLQAIGRPTQATCSPSEFPTLSHPAAQLQRTHNRQSCGWCP